MITLRRFLLYLIGWVGRWLVPDPPTHYQRILLIKPDHLGDMLLCTPALRLLRERSPEAHITMLAGPWSVGIIEHNPDIDTLLMLPFPAFDRNAPRLPRPLARLWPYYLLAKYAVLLRSGRYDVALLLRDDHWWGTALALLAGIPQRVGYATPENWPLLTQALPWQSGDHVTMQALLLVDAIEPVLAGRGTPRRASATRTPTAPRH
ncbi:MAG: glycosyltransferase family 9 protein, partial [Chloroflexaceae bacterium]|nr:glycosyltransferase family 9 protein [Chloroflexaceae bacterium]